MTTAAAIAAAVVLVAFGSAAGRFRIVPAEGLGRDVGVSSSSALVLVPVPSRRLHDGDLVMLRSDGDTHDRLYRVHWADSWKGTVEIRHGNQSEVVQLAEHSRRVSEEVPYAGLPLRFLVGWVQGIVLLLLSMSVLAAVAVARIRRRYEARIAELTAAVRAADGSFRISAPLVRRRFLTRPGWWLKVAGVTCWGLGLLSLTASATFSSSASVGATTFTAGHLALSIDGAGATNRLTLGATGIAPGDTMQRFLDVTIGNNTNDAAGNILTGLKLAIAASDADNLHLGTDSTDGIKVWISRCTYGNGTSGWTESGSTPAFTYTCDTGGGATQVDVVGTSGSPAALSTYSSATAISNVTVTPNAVNHLVVKLTFPSTASDSMQDATTGLTFTFTGTQRSGTDK